jgi:release factor glutamine methyltransferase
MDSRCVAAQEGLVLPVSLQASELAAVVAELRAAGCVFAEEEAELLADSADSAIGLADLVRRRAGGLPLEQVLGWAEFCGLRIIAQPGVFVPRRRSEFLVGQGTAVGRAAAPGGEPLVILDLCCGAGAIGLALATALGGAELHAADVDPVAVRCARANLGGIGLVYEGDLYEPLPAGLRGRVDILIANAPYVPTAEIALMPPEARLHEPGRALDGGADGVDVHRRIAAGAPAWVAPGGSLLIETSERQAPLTAAAIEAAGLRPQIVVDEDWPAAAVIGRAAG